MKRMTKTEKEIAAHLNFKKLPEVCMAHIPGTRDPIFIHRGVSGYVPAPADFVAAFNEDRLITQAQVNAMISGSMAGWHVPAADPDTYKPKTAKARRKATP